jgi:xanthine dehydrogenase YagR molybdenum-binding subunit
MGVSINTWGGGRGPARAHCEITSDGVVVMRLGTQDLDTGTRTLVAVITADALGRQPSQVRPEIGDSASGVSPMSGGSTTASSISPGIRVAAINALHALKEKVERQCRVGRCERRPHPRQG